MDGPGDGTSFEVKSEPLVLGREVTADIQLESLQVSRRHAKIWERDGQVFLQDLGSQNGTFVNGLPTDFSSLSVGDEVVLGEVALTFTETAESPSVTQAGGTSLSEPPEFSLTETIQSLPDRASLVDAPEQRWTRLPKDIVGLAIMNEVSRLAATSQMGEFLESAMDLAVNAVEAQRGVLLLINARSNTISPRVIRSFELEETLEPPFSKAIARYVMRRGIGIFSTNAIEDERFAGGDRVEELELRSVICVPMRFRGRMVGVIHLDNIEPDRFGQKELLLINAIAAQAASFIENSRLEEKQKRDNLSFRRTLQSSNLLIGKSRRIREIVDIIRLVAPTDSTVLLRGESGTGKEVIARAIHRQSMRNDRQMIVVNCAALSPTILESELFGHEKGAFTGAHQRRLGRFELAHGGTILLDEIAELPLELQAKLLRVQEEREFERVGGTTTIKVDVRIMASTNRNLQAEIRNENFREDLYFRLKVIEIELPPLRERMEDVPLLAQHFLQTFATEMGRPMPKLSSSATDLMMSYSWPGNIRELRNMIERAIVLFRGETIDASDLQVNMSDSVVDEDTDDLSLNAAEEHQIKKVLRITGWNKSQAAKLLGISRARLDRRIKHYGLSRAAAFQQE